MRRLLLICAIVGGIACGDSTSPGMAAVAGTWSLQSVNGSPLPYTISQGSLSTTQIASGTLVVSRSGTFTDTTTVATTANGEQSTSAEADSGSYSLNGAVVSFAFVTDGLTGTGLLNGDSVTVALSGYSLLYTKK